MSDVAGRVGPIVVLDDEPEAVAGMTFLLESNGFENILGIVDSREAVSFISRHRASLVLVDLRMPHVSGQEIIDRLAEENPDLPVIVVTGANDIDVVVDCMRRGAYDYLVKPVREERLVTSVKNALELSEIKCEYARFKQKVFESKLEHAEAYEKIIGRSGPMTAMLQYIDTVAASSRPVLVAGETGVGKELAAEALHGASGLRGELVKVNVAGLDDNVFSDTLFGHIKGAFTGAQTSRAGLIARAQGGTLFLDEIGDLDTRSQTKLLRLLQNREYFPLGADMPRESDARVVVATNRDLKELTKKKEFRQDLYFRLQTHHLRVPSLRERLEDLPALCEHFLDAAAQSLGKEKPTAPPELVSVLSNYHFPGNVRELESMVFEAVSLHRSHVMSILSFKEHIARNRSTLIPEAESTLEEGASPLSLYDRLPTLKQVQKMLIEEAVRRTEGNQTQAAEMLGITQSGLSKALKRISDEGV